MTTERIWWWTTKYRMYSGSPHVTHPVVLLDRPGAYAGWKTVRGLTGKWKGRVFTVTSHELTSYRPTELAGRTVRLAPGASEYVARGVLKKAKDRGIRVPGHIRKLLKVLETASTWQEQNDALAVFSDWCEENSLPRPASRDRDGRSRGRRR